IVLPRQQLKVVDVIRNGADVLTQTVDAQLNAVDDEVGLGGPKEIGQVIPLALLELGADAQSLSQLLHQLALETGRPVLVVAGADVGCAPCLVAAPAQDAALANLVQSVGAARGCGSRNQGDKNG